MCVALVPSVVMSQQKGVETHKDWKVACDPRKDAQGNEYQQCYMLQDWNQEAQRRRVLQVAIAYPGNVDGQVMAVFTMPLGVFLPPGVSMAVDKNAPSKFPFQRCESWPVRDSEGNQRMDAGCKAAIRMPDELVNSFKRGNKANIVFHAYGPQGKTGPVNVPVSLSGFTSALNSLQSRLKK